MKKFLKKSLVFIFLLSLLMEIIIRINHLAPDIPQLYLDKSGIQRYKPGQTGYYTKAKQKWRVNRFGWLGVDDLTKDTIITVIGDSYIENIMNPIECNQGSLLKSALPNYSFFEAGRSGVTFIEAVEIAKALNSEVRPEFQLLYLGNNDFYESISEIKRYTDRVQVSVDNQKLQKSKLKSTFLKKVFYNIKLLYYIYLNHPVFVSDQNKNEAPANLEYNNTFDDSKFEKLFLFCSKNYSFNKLVFVLHPNTDGRFVELAKKYGIKTILLNNKNMGSWMLSKNDEHWSCFGHQEASKQVVKNLNAIINNNKSK